MDIFVVSKITPDYLRSLTSEVAKIKDPNVVVFIANSNVTHKLSDSEYPKRKKACEDAVKVLNATYPEVKYIE